jgi:hypothetical protein
MKASSGLKLLNLYTIIGAAGFAGFVFFPDLLDVFGWSVEAAHVKEHNGE